MRTGRLQKDKGISGNESNLGVKNGWMLYIPNVVPQGLHGCLQGRQQDSSKSWAKPSGSLRRIGVLILDVLDLDSHHKSQKCPHLMETSLKS